MVYNNYRHNNILDFVIKNHSLRAIIHNESIYFCGPDLAKILGYKETNHMYVLAHSKDKIYVKMNTYIKTPKFSGNPNMVFISLAGVFRILSRSRHSLAREVQEYICSNVLPKLYIRNNQL